MPWDYGNLMKMSYGPKTGFALGHEDPRVKQGRWRLLYPMVAEMDQMVIDPPLKDSKVTMIDGVDTSYEPSYPHIDRYKGMPYDVWRKEVLYRENPTIKHIYNNWDISPEHPGMQFRTELRQDFTYAKYQGMFFNSLGLIKNFGGRYMDAPNGEQCLVKTFAPMKITLGFTTVAWVFDLVGGTQPVGWKNQAKMFFKISSLPPAAAAWGSTSCILCAMRRKDDNWNYFWGGVAYGSVFGFRLGTLQGFQVGALAVFVTMGWRMFIDFDSGFTGFGRRFNTVVGSALAREGLKIETNWRDIPGEKKW